MFKKVNRNLMELFFENPTKSFHLRKIAKRVGVSPRTAKSHLEKLKSEDLISSRKEGIYLKYKATRNQKFKDWKVFYTIRRLREVGLLKYLNKTLNYPTVVLYGSAGKGEDVEESDLDLFVVTKTKEKLELNEFESKLGKEIQLVLRTNEEIKKMRKKNPELLNSVSNGVVLSGYLEVL